MPTKITFEVDEFQKLQDNEFKVEEDDINNVQFSTVSKDSGQSGSFVGQFLEVAEIEKAEDKGYTFVWAPVLVPESTDHQGDIVSANEIEDAMHQFAIDLNKHKSGNMANQEPDVNLFHEIGIFKGDADIVEVGVLRAPTKIGGRTLKKGTGFIGMRVYNSELRKAIKKGMLRGFSIEGISEQVEV